MANKKCPKCGEDNPAEAVMCWACYTPLTASAGAAMGAGAGMGGGGTATMPRAGTAIIPGADDGAAKKQIDPRIFFVAGGLLFAALIGAFTTGMIGGGGDTSGMEVINSAVDVAKPMGRPPAGMNPIPGTSISTGTGSGGTSTTAIDFPPTAQNQKPWKILVAPSPRYSIATFAIAPAQEGMTAADAQTMARNAWLQYAPNGKWTKMQIVVFSTAEGGQTFKQYMSDKKGEPLGGNDYANLAQSGAWKDAVLYYKTEGNGEKPYYPYKNPTGWWSGLT